MAKKKAHGSELFNDWYHDIYGARWETLKASLLLEHTTIAYNEHLRSPYFLDKASVLAAQTLPVKPGDCVLDMCAAPGGKTLVLAVKLAGSGKLISNDRSAARRIRLKSVLDTHLSAELRSIVSVTGHDATRWGLYEQQTYDHVLLDAPCSSERHVIQDEHALSQWSPQRPKRLAIQQFAMLAAALEAVKPGGSILYSTCSINPAENQGVIDKLFQRRPERITELPITIDEAEPLHHGCIILPDAAEGKGPLYICHLRRNS